MAARASAETAAEMDRWPYARDDRTRGAAVRRMLGFAVVALMLPIGGGVAANASHAARAATAEQGSFQALYLVPKNVDVVAGRVKAMRRDLNKINGWFSRQTVDGVQPRWVRHETSSGKKIIDVVIVHLPKNGASYEGPDQADVITADLGALGWPKKGAHKMVAFFEGSGPGYCGITGQGLSLIPMAACGIYPDAGDTWPYGATYVTAHEMTHNFGAVPACAPHDDGTGHIADDPRDILYGGAKPREWDHLKLDPGHDDYYDTHIPGCRDIKSSRYWTAPVS
jgi:hypothetical protein